MLYRADGIIIGKEDSGEFDRFFSVYTKEYGKVTVKARSVRKETAKLKGHLDLFSYNRFSFALGRRHDIITGAETIAGFYYLRQNFYSLLVATYFSEILDKLIVGPQQDERIWNLLLLSCCELDKFADVKQIKRIVFVFENQLSNYLGYGKQKDFVCWARELANGDINSYFLMRRFL